MANVISAQTAAATSSDIVIAAETKAVFAVIGTFAPNESCAINLKGSAGGYDLIKTEVLPGSIMEGILSNLVTTRVINNPGTTSITVRLVKTATSTAVGIDQY